jgi:hypothetical protein
MFARLAKFRPLQSWRARVAFRGIGVQTKAANDNRPGVRHPALQRRIPQPTLTCQWNWVGGDRGRLECRWQLDVGSAELDDPDQPRADWIARRWRCGSVALRRRATTGA